MKKIIGLRAKTSSYLINDNSVKKQKAQRNVS